MSLTETLAATNAANRKKIPQEALNIMDAATTELIAKQLASQALGVGDAFPDFTLPNATGKEVSLSSVLQQGSVVISFYRGNWCPYCNLELRALQAALPNFKELGAQLLAITPETPDNSLNTKEKNDLTFEVLTDRDNGLAKKIGLVFQLPAALQELYANFGIDMAKHYGNANFELPMPGTFVLDSEGDIAYAFVNEDYTKRANMEDIIATLEKF